MERAKSSPRINFDDAMIILCVCFGVNSECLIAYSSVEFVFYRQKG